VITTCIVFPSTLTSPWSATFWKATRLVTSASPPIVSPPIGSDHIPSVGAGATSDQRISREFSVFPSTIVSTLIFAK